MQSSSQIVATNKRTFSFLQVGCPSCRPTNSVRTLKENSLKENHRYLLQVLYLCLSCVYHTAHGITRTHFPRLSPDHFQIPGLFHVFQVVCCCRPPMLMQMRFLVRQQQQQQPVMQALINRHLRRMSAVRHRHMFCVCAVSSRCLTGDMIL